MSKDNKMDISSVLENHKKWLLNEEGGERADLRYASLRDANLCGADLRYANLYGADLRYATLYDADLRYATLYGADLRDANLYGADLCGASLRYADLRDANLRGADLRYADLWNVSGNRKQIKSIFVAAEYSIVYTSEYLQIGCERHPISEWWEFDDARISQMDGSKALNFWAEWKETIRKLIEAHPAEPTAKPEVAAA